MGSQTALKKKNENMETKIAINTDWIEFTANKTCHTNFNDCKIFNVEKLPYGTSYFSQKYLIKYKNDTIATLEDEVRVSFISKTLIKIKLENHVNYKYDCEKLVEDICKEFKLDFKHYCRLDYAIDFQEITCRNYTSVQKFLNKISSGSIRMKSKSLTIHREGNEVTGVTFGKRISGLAVTIYNKSREMRQKVDKRYIRQQWRELGFDMSKDTYRIEFSMRKPRTEIINDDCETLGTFEQIDFINSENIKKMAAFSIDTNKFYQLKNNEQRIELLTGFNFLNVGIINKFKRLYTLVKTKSNNIKKSVIKHLLMESLFLQKAGKKIIASASFEMIKDMAYRSGLEQWLHNLVPEFQILRTEVSALDYLTSKELKEYGLSKAVFMQAELI